MPSPCTSHDWTHSTEPCPYCRETGSTTHHFGPAATTGPPVDESRTARLSRAIVAAISGDAAQVDKLFTHDVVGTGPVISVTSRAELAGALEEREGALLDVEVQLSPLEVSGNQAAVEWVASAVPSTSLAIAERHAGELVPTARRFRVRAVTVAEFDGDLISSFRSYWNDFPLLDEIRDDAR